MKKWTSNVTLIFLVFGIVLMSGCTSSRAQSGDVAALDKSIEINNRMQSSIQNISKTASSHDTIKMGQECVIARDYIDQNLPEMRNLAYSATANKAALLEYVSSLEDYRTFTDFCAQTGDKYKEGDIDGAISSGKQMNDYLDKANAHLDQFNALM